MDGGADATILAPRRRRAGARSGLGDQAGQPGLARDAARAGDLRVDSVRCVRRTGTDARCVAELFDKSGDGPIAQRVTVSIEQDSGDYFWQAGPAYQPSFR